MKKIAIIGAGNLGIAIAEGLIKNKAFLPEQIIATRNNLQKIEHLKSQGVTITSDNHFAVKEANYILLCVKPYKVTEVLEELEADFIPTICFNSLSIFSIFIYFYHYLLYTK